MSNVKTYKTGIAIASVSADPSSPVEGQIQNSDGTHRTAGLWQYLGGAWERVPLTSDIAGADMPHVLNNIGLSVVMAANAVTIALKQEDGSTDPNSSNPVGIGFRSSTITSGTYNLRNVTSSLSTVISSGSTGGTQDATAASIYIYAIDNSGTVELAWSRRRWSNENELVTTTAEGGAGAADDGGVMYSTTARTNVPFRLIGKFVSTQTTAGTWATAASEVSVGPQSMIKKEFVGARHIVGAKAFASGSNTIIDFDSATNGYDPQGSITTGASWKFTAKEDGYFTALVNLITDANGWTAGQQLELFLYLDGSLYCTLDKWEAETATTQQVTVQGATDIYLTKGQYIDARLTHNRGANINSSSTGTDNQISIKKIGE